MAWSRVIFDAKTCKGMAAAKAHIYCFADLLHIDVLAAREFTKIEMRDGGKRVWNAAKCMMQLQAVWKGDEPILAMYEKMSRVCLQNWIASSSEFLRSVDPNHMITAGLEGFLGSSTPGGLRTMRFCSTSPGALVLWKYFQVLKMPPHACC